jgi:DNA polymerase I-like protein with 3'-5' exonuclease and polymerase domains
VADYGQLELRLLAHVTACKSMLDAFKSGGDFHSRTAIGMYPEIQQAVKEGRREERERDVSLIFYFSIFVFVFVLFFANLVC